MTLDEAIRHAEEVAEEKDMQAGFDTDYLCYQMSDTERNQCKKCAEEHRQLAEWLKELKRLKEQEPCEDWYDVPSNEMTLEQARQAVKDLRKKLAEYLTQEPCEDCISRQDALNCLTATGLKKFDFILGARNKIKNLPSATPQSKTGRWIYTGDYITDGMLKCSECGFEHDVSERFVYCPNCGAKMQQESK